MGSRWQPSQRQPRVRSERQARLRNPPTRISLPTELSSRAGRRQCSFVAVERTNDLRRARYGVNVHEVSDRDAAFQRVVVPEIEILLRVARSITGSAADAEDVVQDTLLRAFRAIDRFDGEHPRAWLLTILRNAQRNRTRKRRPELLNDPDSNERERDAVVALDDPAHEATRGAFDREVRAAFASLSSSFQATVELVDIHGLTCEQAAALLGVAPGTVMSRLHRARAKMKVHLARSGVHADREQA